jgi:hypothetical protein
MADAANHAIPTEAETATSLGRLAASGLLEPPGERLQVTAAGASVYAQGAGNLTERPASVLDALRSVACVDGTVDLAPGRFRAAYEEYLRR